MAESIIFGYARVSSKEQNLDGQYILLKKVGCQEIIEEKRLCENIDINSAVGNMQFQMFAAFAEFEREIIRERTLAGLEAARARGRKGGRKPVLSKQQAQQIETLYDNGTTVVEIAKSYGVFLKNVVKCAHTTSLLRIIP